MIPIAAWLWRPAVSCPPRFEQRLIPSSELRIVNDVLGRLGLFAVNPGVHSANRSASERAARHEGLKHYADRTWDSLMPRACAAGASASRCSSTEAIPARVRLEEKDSGVPLRKMGCHDRPSGTTTDDYVIVPSLDEVPRLLGSAHSSCACTLVMLLDQLWR